MMLYALFTLLLLMALAIILRPLLNDQTVPKRQRLLFTAATAAFFFVGAFGLYAGLGSPDIIPLLRARDVRIAEIKQTILSRSDAVKTNPNDLPAWVELGQAFIETGQYTASANTFRQGVLLSGGNPRLIMAYAKSLILSEGGKVSDDAKKSLEMALLQEPSNAEARYWLIVRQLQDGQTQEAMTAMRTLYHSLPDDSPVKQMIDAQIGRK